MIGRKTLAIFMAVMFGIPMFGIPVVAFPQSVRRDDAKAVRRAIRKGIAYLKSRQNPTNGSWAGLASHRDGSTALVTLALLNAGVSKDDPVIKRALKRIRSFDSDRIQNYTVSLRIMAFCAADPVAYRPDIQRDVKWLEQAQVKDGPNLGGWSYYQNANGSADGSNAQFSLLALHEARLAGVEVDQQVWQRARQYWNALYRKRIGGFSYYPIDAADAVTGSMTCAGISSMIIIHENMIDTGEATNLDIQCCRGNVRPASIDRAIDWIGSRDTLTGGNPTSSRVEPVFPGTKLYFLYGLERAGRLAGIRYFGEHDWYFDVARHLVIIQNHAGFWTGLGSREQNSEISTALALLFLSKGRRPIAIGKYRYGENQQWDEHPKGVHYLTRHIEGQWKMKLNWQNIDSTRAEVNDLLEAPVLFISGREAIELSAEQKEALREYIFNGGFVFAEACQGDGCGDGVPFDRSFRELMKEILPDSRLDVISPSHDIWQAHHKIQPDPRRPVLGIQSCCRTSVIYVPANLSGLWQLKQPGLYDRHRDPAKAQIDYTIELGTNVIAYATNRELKTKGERPQVQSAAGDATGARLLEIPKLTHGGGDDDAPSAWSNALRRFEVETRQSLRTEKTFVAPNIEQLQNYAIVFMHGRSKFSFDEAQRAALKTYLERGGVLIIDSICASQAFNDSVQTEMRAIFPNRKFEPIPAASSMWQKDYGGFDLRSVTLNTPIRGGEGNTVRSSKTHPQLQGISIDGKYNVIFSPNDLSCALENSSPSQCTGYTRDDAAKIATNIILYALLEVPRTIDAAGGP